MTFQVFEEELKSLPLKEALLRYIEGYDNVTFAELAKRFGERFSMPDDPVSNSVMELPGNIVLWVNVTKEASDALNELLAEKKIYGCPAHFLIYLSDGMCLKFPLATHARGYKTPHWLPVVFRPGAGPPMKKPARRKKPPQAVRSQ